MGSGAFTKRRSVTRCSRSSPSSICRKRVEKLPLVFHHLAEIGGRTGTIWPELFEARTTQAIDIPGAVLDTDHWIVFLDPGDTDVRLQTFAFSDTLSSEL